MKNELTNHKHNIESVGADAFVCPPKRGTNPIGADGSVCPSRPNGITLIALIITIIVMLILVAVTINVALNEGLFTTAKQATEETQYQADYETLQAAIATALIDGEGTLTEENLEKNLPDGWSVEAEEDGTYTVTSPDNNVFNSGDILGNIEVGEQKDTITTDESYVGYYADIDADGTVDGVIYADLAFANSGEWGYFIGSWVTWSYDAITDGLKDYYISEESYAGDFGTQDVLSPLGEGEDRFYVMALEDLDDEDHYWYYNAHGNLDTTYNVAYTDDDFGEGRENTQRMIKSYEEEEYGAPYTSGSSTDMWGMEELKEKATEEGGNWFVPSKSEWAAFGDVFSITESNYSSDFSLNKDYWSSSQYSEVVTYHTWFEHGIMGYQSVHLGFGVRLSTTF